MVSAIRILFLPAANDLPSGDGLPRCFAAFLPPQGETQVSRLSVGCHGSMRPWSINFSALYRRLGHHGRSGLGVVHHGGEPDKALRPAGLTLSFWRAARTYAGMIRPSAGLSPTIGPL
jgi:hypothetical protein